MQKRLIPRDMDLNPDYFGDEWMNLALVVEQMLIDAGAECGKDYSLLNLFELSQPFMLEKYKDPDFETKYDQ